MLYPFILNKDHMILGAAAMASILGSSLVMQNLRGPSPDFAMAYAAGAYPAGGAEIASQSALNHDLQGIAPAPAGCEITLDLLDEGNAVIGGTLLAPCNPGQDLVIAHAGMVISGKTLESGAMFFSLPALEAAAQVDIRLSSGETATAMIDMPSVATVQRVVMQWPYADGFALHAYENGAGFDSPGHIWAKAPALPEGGAAATGGYLNSLGDDTVAVPLMAQVFTYYSDRPTDVQLEAEVTQATCGKELMGDLITSDFGDVTSIEVSLAMPDCDAVGEFVSLGSVRPALEVAQLR